MSDRVDYKKNDPNCAAILYSVYTEDDVEGFGAEATPESVESDARWLYFWAEDSAANWSVDSQGLATVTLFVRVHNAELGTSLSSRFKIDGQLDTQLIERERGDDYIEYEYTIVNNPEELVGFGAGVPAFDYDDLDVTCNAILLGGVEIFPIDATQTYSVELLPCDLTQEPIAHRSIDGVAAKVDVSQINLIGAEIKGDEDLKQLEAVSISSHSPVVGSTLTATVNPAGANADYFWYRDDAQIATGPSYKVTVADAGCVISVKAVGKDGYTGTVSDSTKAVPKISVAEVSIAGEAKVGETLTASALPKDASVDFEWKIDGAVVSSTASYTIQAADAGKTIVVTATGKGGSEGVATAEVVVAKTTKELTRPTLTVTAPVVGDTIAVNTLPSGETATYQWVVDGTPIEKFGGVYEVSDADVGKREHR
ncbi:MAG: hypothetical protein HUK22_04475, partial [Thermoguttaceae bacterium]|nr:hypothetical protein [Thermoguttaceae bacterium]